MAFYSRPGGDVDRAAHRAAGRVGDVAMTGSQPLGPEFTQELRG
jgi:hypothetical protein